MGRRVSPHGFHNKRRLERPRYCDSRRVNYQRPPLAALQRRDLPERAVLTQVVYDVPAVALEPVGRLAELARVLRQRRVELRRSFFVAYKLPGR